MAFPVITDATWLNSGTISLDAGELRRADGAIFAGTGATSGATVGVAGGIVRHADNSLLVTIDGSDNITVQAGSVVIPGNAVSNTGPYRSGLASAATNALPTARNATNPRIDLVVYRQLDTDVQASPAGFTARIDVIAGTPAASPVAPTLPAMCVELGRLSIPNSGGGAASVDLTFRTFASAIGGDLYVPTAARLPATSSLRQQARTLDTGYVYEWDGAAWRSVAPHYKGSITSATAIPATTDIAWPTIEDTEAGWGATTANRYTIKRAGIYRFTVSFKWNTTSPASAYVLFKKVAATIYQGYASPTVSFGGMVGTYEYRCAVNDTIAVQSGVGFTTQADGTDNNVFTIDWLRP